VQYPWLLPGYNESLSRFPPGFWSQTPQHTNLVESAHVATNQGTGIKLQPLEAIQLYVALAVYPPIVLTFRMYRTRDLDRSKALSLAAARETCISVNRNNSDRARMKRSITRSARRAVTRTHHSELENSIKDTAKQLDDVSACKSTLAQRLKDLKTEKKTLGRAPRNSHSMDQFGTARSIPRVSSSSSVTIDDEDDSEGMLLYFIISYLTPSSAVEVVDAEILPTPSLVLRPSSPAPSSSSGFNEGISPYSLISCSR
jgi:hypothetical protein